MLAFLPLPTFVLVIALFFLVCEEVLIMSAAGRAFLRPREDLRQAGRGLPRAWDSSVLDPFADVSQARVTESFVFSRGQGKRQ